MLEAGTWNFELGNCNLDVRCEKLELGSWNS